MEAPNVIGEWQDYQSDEWAGLRVRVCTLTRGVPPQGRRDEAKGLTYVSFQVPSESRRSTHLSIDLWTIPATLRLQPLPTTAGDGHRIRRCTPAQLRQLDIQISPEIDGEQVFGYVWVGGLGIHEGSTGGNSRASAADPSMARGVERLLEETAPGS